MSTISNTVFRGIEGIVKKVPSELPAELGPKEILIKITHASLCGTDVHLIAPGATLGHEGVGIVEKVGSAVSQLKVGDRAGAGYLRNSCGHCTYCLKGQDIWCYERDIYGEGNYGVGTFGEYYIGHESFLYKIPDNIPSELAAPLQCAGATVYSAIIDSAKPGDRVAVLGIGGLGHLAIQFSAKLGYETVVFSTTAEKEAEAKSFGASEFYLLSELEKLTKPVDVLLIAGNRYPDWSTFLDKKILARTATIVPLSAPAGNIELPAWPTFFEGYNLKSSLVASRGVHGDMLNFAAHHHIEPVIEKFEFTEKGFAEALEKLNSGKLRYRGVLVAA